MWIETAYNSDIQSSESQKECRSLFHKKCICQKKSWEKNFCSFSALLKYENTELWEKKNWQKLTAALCFKKKLNLLLYFYHSIYSCWWLWTLLQIKYRRPLHPTVKLLIGSSIAYTVTTGPMVICIVIDVASSIAYGVTAVSDMAMTAVSSLVVFYCFVCPLLLITFMPGLRRAVIRLLMPCTCTSAKLSTRTLATTRVSSTRTWVKGHLFSRWKIVEVSEDCARLFCGIGDVASQAVLSIVG